MKTPRIVVVGSSNTDMVVKGRRLPAPGETVTGGQFVLAAGGKGANQAVAAARLGAEVTFVAKVGRDVFGDQAVENYRKEGIRTDYVFRDSDHATGVALILVDEQGENLISVASGANHALTPGDVEKAADRIRAADLVMLQLEIPMETVAKAAELASGSGVPVILNPAPAAPLPDGLLGRIAYLTPNESEAQHLTGVRVEDEATARQAAQRLLAAGAAHVVITLGAKGALLASPGKAGLVPSRRVRAMDTTAAGDAFNGGLAWALGCGLGLDEAVRQACLVGALSVTRLGAQPSLPTKAELDRFAEEG
ncbi:MAG: ribokinase [Thermoguttaceae bacterium]|jgi:ribokinase